MNCLNSIRVSDIKEIVTVVSKKGTTEKMDNRKYYGLSFCTQGQITYVHKGKKYVSDPNHAIILPKGQSYTLCRDKSGIFAVINFECSEFLCDKMITIPNEYCESLMMDFEQMKKLFFNESNRLKVISIFYNMIYKLSHNNNLKSDVLYPATAYLENNYSSYELTNKVLAKQCNISEVYFRKLFTEAYGVTPRQYIIDMRINYAKQFLADGILKINAVAEKCGFSNQYHFCRMFKEKTGLTPTEYMKQNKIDKI